MVFGRMLHFGQGLPARLPGQPEYYRIHWDSDSGKPTREPHRGTLHQRQVFGRVGTLTAAGGKAQHRPTPILHVKKYSV